MPNKNIFINEATGLAIVLRNTLVPVKENLEIHDQNDMFGKSRKHMTKRDNPTNELRRIYQQKKIEGIEGRGDKNKKQTKIGIISQTILYS